MPCGGVLRSKRFSRSPEPLQYDHCRADAPLADKPLCRGDMGRSLIILGIVLIVLGLAWPWLARLGLGRLPGDILIEREHYRIYIPLTTAVVVSLVLSVLFFLFRK